MQAIDYRNATWAALRTGLEARRASVYAAWVVYGPGTTRQVAGEAGIDLLMFRPRTTELLQMGLLAVVGSEGKEGTYRVTTEVEWEDWRQGMAEGQLMLI